MPFKKVKNKDKKANSSSSFYKYLLIGAGSMFFGVVLWIVMSSTRSIVAVVPNQTISPGVTITQNMLKNVDVPSNTPTGYITDANSLLGQKVKIQVDENQLLYSTNIQTSFNMFGNNVEIPKNYILTSVNIPDNNAVSGLVSAGDSVDIAGVPSSNFQNASVEDMEKNLGGISEDRFGSQGINGYWVLSNLKILQSYKSQEEQVNASSTTGNAGNEGTAGSGAGVQQGSYVIAVSYADYKKLLIAQQYLDLYMNIGPKSGFNLDLIKEGSDLNSLKDAQDQDGDKDMNKTDEDQNQDAQNEETSSSEE